jgi:hypothetical protein
VSVVLYFGKTESGKSHKANEVTKRDYKKVILYDNARCFKDGIIISDFSPKSFANIFKKYVLASAFRLIFRAPLGMNERGGAEMVASLIYNGFGRYWVEQNKIPSDRVCFLVDEADKVSSLKIGSPFYLLVTKGRHYGIDTHAISQGPGKIPLYYRENASEVYFFKMKSHPFINENLENEQVDLIRTLEKYHCIHWKDNGDVNLLNPKGRVIKSWN